VDDSSLLAVKFVVGSTEFYLGLRTPSHLKTLLPRCRHYHPPSPCRQNPSVLHVLPESAHFSRGVAGKKRSRCHVPTTCRQPPVKIVANGFTIAFTSELDYFDASSTASLPGSRYAQYVPRFGCLDCLKPTAAREQGSLKLAATIHAAGVARRSPVIGRWRGVGPVLRTQVSRWGMRGLAEVSCTIGNCGTNWNEISQTPAEPFSSA